MFLILSVGKREFTVFKLEVFEMKCNKDFWELTVFNIRLGRDSQSSTITVFTPSIFLILGVPI